MISSTSNYLSTIIDDTIYYATFDENSLNINILREEMCISEGYGTYLFIDSTCAQRFIYLKF